MLDALRRSAGSWVVKVLLGLLVVSFAVWGVGDIFRMGGQTYLAEVGSRSITPQAFQRDYQNQIAMVSNQLGRQLTTQEARSYGIGQRVLENLIGTTAIDIHADKLKLGISDEAVATAIKAEPSFNGANGEFDPQRFQEVLRTVGMNEPGFIALQREEMKRQQLVGALSRGAFVPNTLLDAANHYANDERVLKYFVLPPASVGEVTPPDDAALTAYYNDNKASYMAPEYRKAGVLMLTPDGIKDTITLTDEDVKAAFEST
jgi:peptidyl-prolyl cis-trans isomerase D